MKARIQLTVTALFIFVLQMSAQYCGNSGSTICTPDGTLTESGTFTTENLPCVVRGQANSITMQFKNFSSLNYNGTNITVNSVKIDEINNLPQGICWSTNKSNNIFSSQEDGCITFTGTTSAPIGQYKLEVLMTMQTNVGVLGPGLSLETIGMDFYLRVKNAPTSICPPVDSNQTVSFSPGVDADSLVYISGLVYNDANSNGVHDNTEVGLRNVKVDVGNVLTLTNAYGYYGAYKAQGAIFVTPLGIQSGALSFPGGGRTVNATTGGQEYTGNNFAATISPSYCETILAVANTSTPPRPGFSNNVRIAVANTLSQSPLTLTISLTYNSYQGMTGSTQSPSNTGAGYAEWTISNLALGATWTSDLVFQTSTNTPLGTIVAYSVQVNSSSCAMLTSQAAVDEMAVVGSYDPNDKAVAPIGYSDHHGINPNQVEELTYKIRFQNTGTFLAEKVEIVDTISQRLDLSTLKVLSASHNYDVRISNDRAVKFIFNQIMLPDSNSNEEGSHGYIQYAIKLKDALTQNTQVTNKADIYFDFNEPIRTNTAYNTIDFNTGIKEVKAVYSFNLLPNPTTGNVQINADAELQGKQITVSDINGKILLQRVIEAPVMNMQLGDLANGVYLIQAGGTTKKLIKE